ncbi:MAG: PAS domain-containing protein [Dehalococcoidia bacterium]
MPSDADEKDWPDEAKQALDESGNALHYAEAIFDTVREAVLVLHSDLRVKSANHSFYEFFEVEPSKTESRMVYELGNGQWDIPDLRASLRRFSRTTNSSAASKWNMISRASATGAWLSMPGVSTSCS